MKLKVAKNHIDDPSEVEVDELLKGCVKELPDLSGYATKEELNELIEGFKSLSILLHQGVFDLVAPINVTSFSEIEQIDSISEGVLYWDWSNKRPRLKTDKGWKTVKLE